jgi:capsular exopolysaccharide synthesis family protein
MLKRDPRDQERQAITGIEARDPDARLAAPHPVGSYLGTYSDDSEGFNEFASWLRIVRKRKGTLLVVAFLGALTGLLIQLPRSPLYRASVSVEVQAQNEDFFYGKDVNPNSTLGSVYPDIDLATQVKVLETRALRNRVIEKLDADNALRIVMPEDRLSAWRKILHLPDPPPASRQSMLLHTAESVKVKPARTTRVIEITCESPDPALAAAFANTMASEYREQSLESRWQSAKHTGEWLGRQLDDMKVKLQKSEEDLQSYAVAMNLILTGDKDKGNVADDKLRQMQTQLSEAQSDLAAKQARYELAMTSKPDSLAQVLDDATLRTYDVKLADLRRELAELSSTLTPAHYKVQRIQSQIAEMESDRGNARDRIIERIHNDFEEAEHREKLLSSSFAAQSAVVTDQAGKIIHYNILQREVDSNRQLYESLLQRVKEAGISSAMRASNIAVIDSAEVPAVPFAPNVPLGVLGGLLTGLCAGFGLVLMQEKTNRYIESPGDAAFYMNLPALGTIPSAVLERWPGASRRAPLRLASFGGSLDTLLPAVEKRGPSVVAEAFRLMLTSLLFIGRKRPAQVMVVTSPGASEGKTTVVSNLALAYAETGRSVLVIDCDMRRPRVHEVFGIPNEGGLAELLAESEPLQPRSLLLASSRCGIICIDILPSGDPAGAAANLLHSKRLPELIALAREQFDVVLIDTPPMLDIADSRIVGSLADGVVLVIRSRRTQRDSAVMARRQLAEDGVPVFGVVLNDWDPKFAGYYSIYDYSKYYETSQ